MSASATTDQEPKTTARHFRSARTQPEIALLLTTYQRPWHLKRVLTSIAIQQGIEDRMELVVADDGSTDETQQVVEQFAASVPFSVRFTTHPRKTFHPARCRNEGTRATTAPYLLFIDGDCLIPPDHVRQHLDHRRDNFVVGGFCCCFDETTTARFDDEVIRSGEYFGWVPRNEHRARAKRLRRAKLYQLIRHPTRPALPSGNIGIWRSDYERINGFDENFQGWGGEDDDLTHRLRRAGVRIASTLGWTWSYHLWHPRDATAPKRVGGGQNVSYLNRKCRLTRCMNGLIKRTPADLGIRVVGEPSNPDAVARFLRDRGLRTDKADRPEVELLFLPGKGRFSGRAECRILVVLEESARSARLARGAHFVVAESSYHGSGAANCFPLDKFDFAGWGAMGGLSAPHGIRGRQAAPGTRKANLDTDH